MHAQHAPAPTHQAATKTTVQPVPEQVQQPTNITQMLQLQRTIGNRATVAMTQTGIAPRIQRNIAIPPTLAGVATFANLRTEIAAFNALTRDDDNEAEYYNQAFTQLRKIDRIIYAYIDQQSTTTYELASIPHYDQLQGILNKSNEKHIQLVDESKTKAGIIPFNVEGMSAEEQASLLALWGQIKTGTGKIKVVSDGAHRKQIFSWLVKLLDSPTGRKLLAHLNAGDATEAITNIYIGTGSTAEKDALPLTEQEKSDANLLDFATPQKSAAQPLKSAQDLTLLTDEAAAAINADDYPEVTAGDVGAFREAVISGKHGITINDKAFRFNTNHMGALVSVFEGVSKNENEHHHQILTPGFITLGHELGHAAHMRSGAVTIGHKGLGGDEDLLKGLSGQNELESQATWQNAEEVTTIKGWENALREDFGLSERASHVPYNVNMKLTRIREIEDSYKDHYRAIDPYYQLCPQIAEFQNVVLRNNKGQIDNDQVYNDLKNKLVILKATYGANHILKAKRQFFKRELDYLSTKFKEKTGNWTPSIFKKRNDPEKLKTYTGYKTFKQRLKDNEAAYVGLQNNIIKVENEVREYLKTV